MSSSGYPAVFSVLFNHAKSSFGLYGSVHPQIGTMDAFKVFQDFFVDGRQFLVQVNTSVLVCLLASLCIRTSATVFTGIDLHLPAVAVPGHRLPVGE